MLKYFLLAAVFFGFSMMTQAQTTDDQTRDIWDTAFMKKRPAGKKKIKRKPVRYRIISNKTLPVSSTSLTGASVLGVTIWRLRPSKAADDEAVRQLIYEQGEWTPERVSAGTPLSEGSRVQMTIESPRTGYIYVFDREIYADKTFGEPYLIFPTLSINGGDNRVTAGRVVEIPSSRDKPPFYILRRSSSNHEGENITVIVTDRPLTEIVIGRNALKISAEQFYSYEQRWGALTQQLELEGGSGLPMNKVEKAAGEGKRALTQNDSPPQTIYRVLAKPNQPLLLTIPLPIGETDRENEKPKR
jgi:hypothetical protein